MVYAQNRRRPRKYDTENYLGFERQKDHLVLTWRPELVLIKKKITCDLVDFAVIADHEKKRK